MRLALALIVVLACGCQQSPPSNVASQPKNPAPTTNPVERTMEAKDGDYIAILTLTKQRETVLFGGPWGAFGTNDEVATDLTVYFKGKETPVWRSSFGDLANVNEMTVTAKGADATIAFVGGDAHSSFRCKIDFKNGQIKSRRVESGEFPENHYETTQYVEIPAGD